MPAVEYSYFDATQKMYKTLTSKPIVITVAKGTGKLAGAVSDGISKKENQRFTNTVFTNRLWFIFPVALLILTGLFFWIKTENNKEKAKFTLKEKEAKSAIIEEPVLPVNPLTNTEASLVQHDSKGFYEALNKELRQFLATQLGVPIETINKKRIAEALDSKGVTISTSLHIQQLLNDIEWQLYTPFVDENKMEEMYQAANTIVHSFIPHFSFKQQL